MNTIKLRAAHYRPNKSFWGFTFWGRIDSYGNQYIDRRYISPPVNVANTVIEYEDQYVGINDVEGKEIYENDIIVFTQNEVPDMGKVLYSPRDASFLIQPLETQVPHVFFYEVDPDSLLIKGNIYENPELLKIN